MFERLCDPAGDGAHLGLAHAAGGKSWGADADAAGLHGRVGVVGDGVFINGDACLAEGVFGFGAQDAFLEDIEEQEVGVGAAGDDAVALGRDGFSEDFRVGDDLPGVGGEVGLEGFLEGYGFGGDYVHQRAALLAGEDAAIYTGGELLLAEDQAAAGAAQGLVGGGGDDVGVGDGRGVGVACDEAREVGHVDHEVRPGFVRDGAHAGKVELARVGAAAAYDDLGFFAQGDGFELVVVDGFGVAADLVADDAIELAGEVELVAVGEMAPVGEVEAQDAVAGGEEGHVGGGVGLGAGMGLDVGMIGPEELPGSITGEVFDDVGELAAAVVALAGIAFGVFVGEDGACGFEDGAADEVFRGDHLEAVVLTFDFVLDLQGDLGVAGGQRGVQVDGHELILCQDFAVSFQVRLHPPGSAHALLQGTYSGRLRFTLSGMNSKVPEGY